MMKLLSLTSKIKHRITTTAKKKRIDLFDVSYFGIAKVFCLVAKKKKYSNENENGNRSIGTRIYIDGCCR